jgi:exonuclease VII small subunit
MGMAIKKEIQADTKGVTLFEAITERVSNLNKYYKDLSKRVKLIGKGIALEVDTKNKAKEMILQLKDSYKNMKSSNTFIVSIKEFKDVRSLISVLTDTINDVEVKINTSMAELLTATKALKSCNKELEKCQRQLSQFGKVHDFRRNQR